MRQTIPAIPADPRQLGRAVNGFSLGNTLAAAQQIAGSPEQYATLLRSAGMERFVAHPPPPTPEIVATEAEFAGLFVQIYQALGERVMRTMMRNWGEALVPIILGSDLGQQALQQAADVPREERRAWAVAQAAEITNIFWAPVERTEDADAWHLTILRCPICLQIRGAHEPLCMNAAAIYAGVLRALIGQRMQVREVACTATGAEHCRYVVYKHLTAPAPLPPRAAGAGR